MAEVPESELLIIGAGPGGYAAAFHAADKGMKVTLVDETERPGGTCLHVGCIPSKALLHAAKLITDAREGASVTSARADGRGCRWVLARNAANTAFEPPVGWARSAAGCYRRLLDAWTEEPPGVATRFEGPRAP